MAFVPIPNCAEVQLVYNTNGQIIENTLYFDVTAGAAIPDLINLATHVLAWWTTNVKPLLGSYISLVKILATDQATSTLPGIVYTTGLPVAGTRGAPAGPLNVTLSTTFLTVLRGRSFRGRNYWPQMSTDDYVSQTVVTATAASQRAAYNALIAASASWGTPWVVASRYSANAPRAAGVITPVVGVTGDLTIDSQRRRLPGRGR